MSFYTRFAYRLFSEYAENILFYFPDVRTDLKRSGMKISVQEYISMAILTSFMVFLFELPLLSFIFALVFQSFLFGFITAFTTSFFLSIGFFYLFLNYPKATIKSKAKKIDNELPFATLYLSTIIGSRLPLHRAFEIFARFGGYTEIVKEVKLINSDIRSFGLDIHTALERAVERSPSKNFSELLWGILSTSRSGGNIVIYLKEKSKDFMEEYRRKLHQFTRSLALFVEIYLTAIILGSVFFTILTAIISGIGGATGNIFILQFFLIFIFIPLVSVLFIFLVKTAMPGGEM